VRAASPANFLPIFVNGLSLLVLVALAIGLVIAYRAGVARGAADSRARGVGPLAALTSPPATPAATDGAAAAPTDAPPVPAGAPPLTMPPVPEAATSSGVADIGAEKARLIAVLEAEAWQAHARNGALASRLRGVEALADERHALHRTLADARADTARYRQLVIDLENDAPPPLLDGPGAPDDLKLIVGIGPVLERMLQQLGISRYRQIARWSERDIDEFDARLAEFPGRIRRDGWVTQARSLHQSKYGEALPPRERA